MDVVKSNVADIWQVAAERLQQQIHITTYEQWFQNIVPVSLNEKALILGVSDDFFADWLKDNFNDILCDSLKDIEGIDYSYSFESGYLPEKKKGKPKAKAKVKPVKTSKRVNADN